MWTFQSTLWLSRSRPLTTRLVRRMTARFDLGVGFGSVDLVVGDNLIEDGGTAGAVPVLEGGDDDGNHDAVLGVVGGLGELLGFCGFGSSSGRHGCCWVFWREYFSGFWRGWWCSS